MIDNANVNLYIHEFTLAELLYSILSRCAQKHVIAIYAIMKHRPLQTCPNYEIFVIVSIRLLVSFCVGFLERRLMHEDVINNCCSKTTSLYKEIRFLLYNFILRHV